MASFSLQDCFNTRLCDAHIIARELVESITSTNPVELFKEIIPEVEKRLSAEYGCTYKVNCRQRSWEGEQIDGMIFRYKDHSDIFYSAKRNTCWQRFIIAKELSHLLIDTSKDDFSTTDNIEDLVESLINNLPSNPNVAELLASEQVAQIIAAEILFPFKEWEKNIAKVTNGSTYLEIASEYRLPEKIVELCISSRNVYDLLKDIK